MEIAGLTVPISHSQTAVHIHTRPSCQPPMLPLTLPCGFTSSFCCILFARESSCTPWIMVVLVLQLIYAAATSLFSIRTLRVAWRQIMSFSEEQQRILLI